MEKDNKKNKKSAANNQWASTKDKNLPDNRERRDGPGGDNVQGKKD